MKAKLLFPFRAVLALLSFVKDVFMLFTRGIHQSIRLQLLITFVICIGAAMLAFSISSQFFGKYYRTAQVSYDSGKSFIMTEARGMADQIDSVQRNPEWLNYIVVTPEGVEVPAEDQNDASRRFDEWIKQRIERDFNNSDNKLLIVTPDGVILYKSTNVNETKVDIHNIIRNSMEDRMEYGRPTREYYGLYPVKIHDSDAYVVVSGIPAPSIVYSPGDSPLPIFIGFIVFFVSFYFLTKRKMKYIEELAGGLMEISTGNLNFRVTEKSRDELGTLASQINNMTEQLQKKIEEERKAEQTKNELITNVSHDLRTPLTLIMGYLRLLKDGSYENEQQANGYVNIAFGKSEKLKALIDDLFEYTKLTNEGVRLNKERVCLNELLEQLTEELVTVAESGGHTLLKQLPPEKLFVRIDTDQMIRVFENLLTNAIKYSSKPGEILVNMRREYDCVIVSTTNVSEALSEEDVTRLFDRFYRAEQSRSSETGGSGLGLAIAKSIVELHGGHIWAAAEGDQIHFYVKLKLALAGHSG